MSMENNAEPKPKLRPWTWLLGGLTGFFVFFGCEPLFMPGWWYGTFRDAAVGNSIESVEAFICWLVFGPIEGFLLGFFLLRWLDKRSAAK